MNEGEDLNTSLSSEATPSVKENDHERTRDRKDEDDDYTQTSPGDQARFPKVVEHRPRETTQHTLISATLAEEHKPSVYSPCSGRPVFLNEFTKTRPSESTWRRRSLTAPKGCF